ncbi:MAG TPA: DUF2993 domain-containing protein [Nakamurella sp.]|nr:DUF2993 domain-containing protein [Nakamurella sp.]
MRKLAIAVIILLVLLVAADFGARAYAESRAADAIRSEVGTDVTPDVSIEGFPFLWHAVQGSYPQVVISASTTSADAIPGVRAVAELETVALPLRDALAGNTSTLTAQSANVRALIPLDSLAAALGRPDLTLSAGPDGGIVAAATLTVAGQSIPLTGAATISITDGKLTMTVAHLSAAGLDLTPVASAAADALAGQLSASRSLAGLPFAITDAVASVRGRDLVLTVTTGAFRLSQLR